MPMEADFADEFVVGNIDKESGLKKNSFPNPGIVSKPYLFLVVIVITGSLFNTKTF